MKKSIFNINIYRPERKKKKEWRLPSEEIYSGLMIIISFLVLLSVCTYLFLGPYISQKRMLKKSLLKADSLDLKLQRTKAIALNIANKKDLYLQIKGEVISWPEKLVAFSENLSENIWFSKIEFPGRAGSTKKEEQNLLIHGQTFSGLMKENLDQVGDLIIGLNRTEAFKETFEPLRLEYTKKSETAWGMIQFQIIGKRKDLSL